MPRSTNSRITSELTLTELYNDASLKHIITMFQSYSLRPGIDNSATLDKLKKYQATASCPGSHTVSYHRTTPGHGRLFADGGLSLQAMPREIRNAIAFQAYEDVDMVNAQPTFLLQFCDKNRLPCDALRRYCTERTRVLSELATDTAAAKQAVLAIINGGEPSPNRRGINNTTWLQAFAAEMHNIRSAAVQTPDGCKYLDQAQGKRLSANRARQANLLGSAINLLLCDLENDALMAAYEFLEGEGRHVDVMMFDGCMVRKSLSGGPLSSDFLQRASDHVYTKTGYRVVFAIKDMTADMLSVPRDVIDGFNIMLREPRYALDDHAAGRLFLDDIQDIVRSCLGHIWVKANGVWTDAAELTNKILLESCLKANIMHITPSGVVGQMSGNVPAAQRIVTAARALMVDDPEFEERLWHSCIGIICYRNGLWDFRARRFFSYKERPDVLPAHVIPRDFPVNRPSAVSLETVYNRLLLSSLGDPAVVQSYLQFIARGTAGEYTDKQWGIMVGERNCGKGVLQEINDAAWGKQCVNTILANAFLMQSRPAQDAAKALSWALDCRFARQTYTNEVRVDTENRHVKLDGNAIKQFQSGGDVLMARKNHQNERQFRIATRLIMNLNDIPTISPIDAISSMLLFKFPFKFVSEEEMVTDPQPFYRLRDNNIKEFCRSSEAIDAFTWLVIDAYCDGPVVPCEKVLADTEAFREDAGDDLLLVRKHFRITPNRDDFVTGENIDSFCATYKLSSQKVKDRLERMGARYDKNCRVQGRPAKRGYRYVQEILVVDQHPGSELRLEPGSLVYQDSLSS